MNRILTCWPTDRRRTASGTAAASSTRIAGDAEPVFLYEKHVRGIENGETATAACHTWIRRNGLIVRSLRGSSRARHCPSKISRARLSW